MTNLCVSSLVTRTTNDAFQVMQFMQMILRMGMMTPLMFISSFIMIVRTSPSLSWVVLSHSIFIDWGFINRKEIRTTF